MHLRLPKLDLNITNRCNLRCRHCAFDSGKCRMQEMPLSRFREILRETRKLGGERIDITGGEPTLRYGVAGLIRYARSLGYCTELVTNGTALGLDKLKMLQKCGLDSIAVSLDGPNNLVHRLIRNTSRSQYGRAVGCIKDAVSLGLKAKVNTVAFNVNLDYITAITEQSIRLGASEHGIYYFTPVGRGNCLASESVEPVKWLGFIRRNLAPYRTRIKITVEVPVIENAVAARLKKSMPGRPLGCMLMEKPCHLQVLSDGRAYPCAILASYRRPVANLFNNSVSKVWQSRKIWHDYRRLIERQVFSANTFVCTSPLGFGLEKYLALGYVFVCPLRKFGIGEIL